VVPVAPLVPLVVPVPVVPDVPLVPEVLLGVVADVSPVVAGVVSLRLQAPSMVDSKAAASRIFGALASAFIEYSSFKSMECRPRSRQCWSLGDASSVPHLSLIARI
jgi:hypothetical protein